MIQNINSQIAEIERSIAWAKKFDKSTFPVEELKEYRRRLKKIANALSENCSAAAYGESQVGKSYLMSSLFQQQSLLLSLSIMAKNIVLLTI